MRLLSLKYFFAFLLISCYALVMAQYTVPEKPKILYPVYDEVGLLSNAEKESLNQKLIRFADSTSTQIQVVIIPTTKGEDVNFVAWQFGEKWGLRNKEVNNGIVFLIASEDRTMSIQQGRDVEQYLTASVAGQIIDYIVIPNFKQGLWYEGIHRGTTAIMDTVQGKFKPIKKEEDNFDAALTFIIILIIAMIILAMLSKNHRNDDDDDVIITKRGRKTYPGGFFPFPPMGGGSFGSGGSFGGGFGGFGGGGSGGFGGGGASGSW
ncbi:MAG: TPM domain-containing protein [Cruoricaptor ignavus]|nr:TPM domain-containing protein [Cruoricaptor ignavus]